MIDPELKEHLSILEKQLDELAKKERHWSQFVGGIFYGLGYVTGAVVLVVIIGWILNIIGVIPAFNSYVGDFKNALDTFNSSSFH
jgi:uncharacterized membrane protein